jgi:hypothetical protein
LIKGGVLQTLLMCAAFSCPTTGEASVIYSNLGPGDSFLTSPGVYPVWNLTSGGFIDRAASFTVPGPQDVLFESAELGFHLQTGSAAATVQLATNVAGNIPGAIIESINILLPAPSVNPTIIMATSSMNPILTAGSTYWIIASVSVPSTMATWGPNNTGALGDTATRTNFQNGQWFLQPTTATPSLRVNALPAGVPEPSTMLLVGAGLASAAFRRRRRQVNADCGGCPS